ncbi:MAG: SurA N-terminal domain-containing protein [Halieaceae bacterium]
MLQSMRQGAQSTTAKIIIGLIVLSFAAFGLETLLPGGAGTSVAEVNGEEISPFALQEAVTQQKRQLVSILGDDIDPAMLDDDRLQPRALESLIQRALLLQKAAELGLVASDAQIGKSITSIEAFQLNGNFSPEAYKSVLANAGYTPERFRRLQAEDIVLTQLQTAVSESEFVTQRELSAMANLVGEERDVRYLVIPEGRLVASDALSDDALRAYYDAHQSDFLKPEQVVVDYILLAPEDFRFEADEETVRQQFEAVRDEYTVSTQSSVSHILLIPADEESDSDFARRVAEVSERLNRNEEFSDIARELSDDIGSASQGGALGFTDGTAFPEEMEAAIAGLQSPGQVSTAVVTDAGTHFIRLEERIDGDSVSYEDVKDELRSSIESAEAERSLLLAVEELRDLVFNAPDLAGPAAAVSAKVERSEAFSRELGRGLFAEAALRDVAFSPEVFEDGINSEVVELSGKRFAVLRIAEITPSQVAPFDEVESDIAEGLSAELESDALRAMQLQAEQELAAGGTFEDIAKTLELEWRVELATTRLASQLPRPVLEAAFAMPAGDTTRLRAAAVPGAGHALIQLARVTPGSVASLTTAEAETLMARRSSEQQRLSFGEYLKYQRETAEIIVR